jgi:hypothetical protein
MKLNDGDISEKNKPKYLILIMILLPTRVLAKQLITKLIIITYQSKIIYFLCNRTRNEHFAYLKQAAKSNSATAVKVNVILIFDTNQSFHVRLAFGFFRYEIRTAEFITRRYFLTLEEYLHKTAQKVLCTAWPRNPLTS